MKNWLLQRTTWLGIGAAIVAVLGTIDPEWATMGVTILSLFGLSINDRGSGTGPGTGKMKSSDASAAVGMGVIILVFASALRCHSVPIPESAQERAAVTIGCAALEAGGCFAGVQEAFPGINAENCEQRIERLIELVEMVSDGENLITINDRMIDLDNIDIQSVDFEKLSALKNVRCETIKRSLGIQ